MDTIKFKDEFTKTELNELENIPEQFKRKPGDAPRITTAGRASPSEEATETVKPSKPAPKLNKKAAAAPAAKTTGRGTAKTPAKAAKKDKGDGEGAGRTSQYAGKTIKPLVKKHELREGTWTAFFTDLAISKQMTYEAFQEAIANSKEYGDKAGQASACVKWLVAKGYVDVK